MKGFKSTILSLRSGAGGGGGGGALPPYMAFTGMCRWAGMGIDLSVLNWVHNFVRLCTYYKQGFASTIDLICLMKCVCTPSIEKQCR